MNYSRVIDNRYLVGLIIYRPTTYGERLFGLVRTFQRELPPNPRKTQGGVREMRLQETDDSLSGPKLIEYPGGQIHTGTRPLIWRDQNLRSRHPSRQY